MAGVSIEEIKQIVSLQLGVRNLDDNARFMEDLRAESADLMNIVLVIEETYQIVIRESETAKLRTPADLHELVNNKLTA